MLTLEQLRDLVLSQIDAQILRGLENFPPHSRINFLTKFSAGMDVVHTFTGNHRGVALPLADLLARENRFTGEHVFRILELLLLLTRNLEQENKLDITPATLGNEQNWRDLLTILTIWNDGPEQELEQTSHIPIEERLVINKLIRAIALDDFHLDKLQRIVDETEYLVVIIHALVRDNEVFLQQMVNTQFAEFYASADLMGIINAALDE